MAYVILTFYCSDTIKTILDIVAGGGAGSPEPPPLLPPPLLGGSMGVMSSHSAPDT
ncbi:MULTISPECIES: hypothetical protein [Chryseobacterium]|nr:MULTISPECIES: hypothetical protein [Chryseobacterium]QQV03230.1 hypothetical protein I6I61_02390 [Chryseobacterium sp. FDAARGOS 1104]